MCSGLQNRTMKAGFIMSIVSDKTPDCQFDFPLLDSSPAGGLILYRAIEQEGCPASGRPVLEFFSTELQQVVYFRPPCKSWTCPYCAPRRAWMWRKRAEYGSNVLNAVNIIEFVTLTSHERLSPAATLAVLPKAWINLNRRLKRTAGDTQYFSVPEQHKDGRWHMHLIVSMPIALKKKWWKDNARACGMGYQSDVQEVESAGGVGGYVTKYLTKMLQNSNLPSGFRRVRLSHGWPKNPSVGKPEGWRCSVVQQDIPLNEKIERQRLAGLTVVMADEVSVWDWLENFAEL